MLKQLIYLILSGFLFASHPLAAAPSCKDWEQAPKLEETTEHLRSSLARKVQRFRTELPKKKEDWQSLYRDFKTISAKDTYFFNRIKRSFSEHGHAFTREQFAKLLGFNDAQNERYRDVFGQVESGYLHFAFESSFLKLINDKIIGKENATSLNFFMKMQMLTLIIEEAANRNPLLLSEMKRQWVDYENANNKYDAQNDYKIMRLALKLDNYSNYTKLSGVYKRAYYRMKLESLHILSEQYPELMNLLNSKLPPQIKNTNLYNGILADSLRELQKGIKQVRNRDSLELFHYRKGKNPIITDVKTALSKFYTLNAKAIPLLRRSNRLVVNAGGILYPSPTFFQIMKEIAPAEVRKRDNKKQEDKDYYSNIQAVVNSLTGLKLNRGQTQLLVTYYHSISGIIPPMLFTRTEPLLQSISETRFIMSADYINGSGTEMSLVAKYLIKEKDSDVLVQIEAPEKGVNETTRLMLEWSSLLSNTVRASFPADIKITTYRTGDDVNLIFGRQPTPTEIAYFQKVMSERATLAKQSRITWGTYKAKTAIQSKVESLEMVAKKINKAYHYIKTHYLPDLVRFAVEEGSNKEINLVLLEKPTEDQQYLLSEVLKEFEEQIGSRPEIRPLP